MTDNDTGVKDPLPYEYIGDSSEREDWLVKRRQGVGASEIAAALGRNPWTSALALYAQKVDPDPEDEEMPEHMAWGLRLEKPIAEEWEKRTGIPIERAGQLLRSREHPWAICTPDFWAIIEDPTGTRLEPLQIKTTGSSRGWEDGGIPRHYQLQVQHEILVTGAARGHLACLVGSGRFRMIEKTLERNESDIAEIVRRGEEFWQRVLDREPPPPDHTQSATRALHHLYRKPADEVAVLPSEAMDWDEELQELKAESAKLKARRRELENKLKAAIGSAVAGTMANGVSYVLSRVQVPGGTVERKAHTRVALYRKGAK